MAEPASLAERVMAHLGETEPEFRARQLARDPRWVAKLDAWNAQPGILQRIASMMGPQAQQAPNASLAQILNAQRVANPHPVQMPPAAIGVRD